jgi:hypothetical protein
LAIVLWPRQSVEEAFAKRQILSSEVLAELDWPEARRVAYWPEEETLRPIRELEREERPGIDELNTYLLFFETFLTEEYRSDQPLDAIFVDSEGDPVAKIGRDGNHGLAEYIAHMDGYELHMLLNTHEARAKSIYALRRQFGKLFAETLAEDLEPHPDCAYAASAELGDDRLFVVSVDNHLVIFFEQSAPIAEEETPDAAELS